MRSNSSPRIEERERKRENECLVLLQQYQGGFHGSLMDTLRATYDAGRAAGEAEERGRCLWVVDCCQRRGAVTLICEAIRAGGDDAG